MSVLGLIFLLAGIALFVFTNSHAPEKAFTGSVTWVLKPEFYYTFVIASACSSIYGLYEIVTEFVKKDNKEEVLISIDTKKCPACAELIKFEARVCKHCGYNFSVDELMHQKEEREALLKQDEYALKILPEYSLLEIAYDLQHNQDNFAKAKYYLERLLRDYPKGEYTKIAKERLEEIRHEKPDMFMEKGVSKSAELKGKLVVTADVNQSTCPQCKQPVNPGARFCGGCGYRLEDAEEVKR
jgi:hypothetical protein